MKSSCLVASTMDRNVRPPTRLRNRRALEPAHSQGRRLSRLHALLGFPARAGRRPEHLGEAAGEFCRERDHGANPVARRSVRVPAHEKRRESETGHHGLGGMGREMGSPRAHGLRSRGLYASWPGGTCDAVFGLWRLSRKFRHRSSSQSKKITALRTPSSSDRPLLAHRDAGAIAARDEINPDRDRHDAQKIARRDVLAQDEPAEQHAERRHQEVE